MGARTEAAMVWSLMRRGLNEILRVPGAALPGMLAPTIFLLGLTAVFGNLHHLPGYPTDSFMSFILPVSFLQAAGFTGAATSAARRRNRSPGTPACGSTASPWPSTSAWPSWGRCATTTAGSAGGRSSGCSWASRRPTPRAGR